MGYDTVDKDLTVIKSNNCVEGFDMKIQGKANPRLVTLTIWFDHDLTEFCACLPGYGYLE